MFDQNFLVAKMKITEIISKDLSDDEKSHAIFMQAGYVRVRGVGEKRRRCVACHCKTGVMK
jgi:hypothetical protein